MSRRRVAALTAALVLAGSAPMLLPAASASAASCSSYPNWVAGRSYNAGDIVRYTDGRAYIAEHANPGYDPVISTWYWDPYACDGGSDTPPAASSCPRRSSTRCSRAGTPSTATAGSRPR
ncbi:hypothetical protein SHKM778_39950 [Streptomyces sp. KM77-8]|uniref:Chitin-binding type-3 domain-containing protein n=1 Tax=Streptomyces haneummycinicus TaxID=3074435 RepID=A0AAT9HJK8_9ACTN